MTKPPVMAVPRPEFSREVALDAVGAQGYEAAIEADAGERAALAERFGLLALDALKARFVLARDAEGDLRLAASFEADVVQACVITLEPVAAHLAESFELVFSEAEEAGAGEIVVDPLDERTSEPLVGEVVDVGEYIAQQLALALDPYPRKPGATVETHLAELGLVPDEERGAREGPFVALGAFKGRLRRTS